MSRGPGRIMRAVEERLTDSPQTIHALAGEIFAPARDDYLEREHIESVRRAAKRLADLGRADLGFETWNTAFTWYGEGGSPREFLTVCSPGADPGAVPAP